MSLEGAIDELLTHPKIVVGVDFDGTISSLVDHPDLAIPDAAAVEALRTLAGSDRFRVVVVSGRSHAALSERLGEVNGAVYIGEHGNDTGEAGSARDGIVAEMGVLVETLAAEIPGAVTERKAMSATFHYRNVPNELSAPALDRIEVWLRRHPDVSVIEGKSVLELTIATKNKGDAIMELAGDDPVIYIGDDTTDETVFLALRAGDVGVKVGEGATAALFRVEDVAGVVTILEQMVLASS